ncbi:MAG: endonuclease/exonuclease/phosphatase family protein [Rhizobiaceae bacterium]
MSWLAYDHSPVSYQPMLDRPQTFPNSIAAALRRSAPRAIRLSEEACTTVASYNVHKCVGTDGRFDPMRAVAVLAELDADLVALQEADARTGARHGLLDLEALRRETDLVPTHLPENARSHGWHGNLILARKGTVHAVRTVRLPGLEPRGAVIVDLELKGVALRVVAAHLGLLRHSRAQQAHALVEATHPVMRPTLLLGDFNEWRVRTRSSLLTLLPHFGPIDAALPSFPSRLPLLALDRILARPARMIASIEVHQSPLARVASDHLPLKARLDLESLRTMQSAQAAQPNAL